MDNLLTDTLFGSDTLRVDHHRIHARPCTRLAVTFTSFGNQELDGLGFAGRFLLREGYDLLAFKLVGETWYQGVPAELFEWLRLRMARFCYHRRVGYGSSMGGYAAIQFAGRLALDQVLALSPQFTVEGDFDARWAPWGAHIDFQYRIDGSCLAPGTRVLIVYDRYSPDHLHATAFRQHIPAERLRLAPIPFAGHPVEVYLSQLGRLKQVARQGLALGHLSGIDVRTGKAKCLAYLSSLSLEAHHRGRAERSLRLVERALDEFPDVPVFHSHRSALLELLGRHDEAVEATREGIERCPEHHELLAYQAQLLEQLGDPDEALRAIRQALRIAPEHAGYRERLAALQADGA